MEYAYEEAGFALRISRFLVEAGERVAVTGPSGCGKTTFLHLLAGILTPSRGEIRLLGEEIPRLSDAARRRFRIRRIGLIFQEFELIEHLTVRENALLPYFVSRTLTRDGAVEEELVRLAGRVGLAGLLHRRPAALSHGERQRVAIARALCTGPELILADEPTGNLDPKRTGEILDLVFEEVARRGLTFVMVTHDHTILDRFDRVVDLGEGAR